MNCKVCKNKIEKLDVYCSTCGTALDHFKKFFSVKEILNTVNKKPKTEKDLPAKISIMVFILSIFPVFIISYISNNELFFEGLMNYAVSNILFIFFIPISLLIFSLNYADSENKLNLNSFCKTFKNYPRYFLFILLTALYFVFLKIICQGDPILNLVRLVLILWGLSIVLPMPVLMAFSNESVIKLIQKAYIAGKYTRWQQFFILIYLSILNFIAVIPFGIGLIYSLPYTVNVLQELNKRHNEYGLYDKHKDY